MPKDNQLKIIESIFIKISKLTLVFELVSSKLLIYIIKISYELTIIISHIYEILKLLFIGINY